MVLLNSKRSAREEVVVSFENSNNCDLFSTELEQEFKIYKSGLLKTFLPVSLSIQGIRVGWLDVKNVPKTTFEPEFDEKVYSQSKFHLVMSVITLGMRK